MDNVKSPIFLRLGNRARHYLSTKKGIHRPGGELPEGVSADQRPGVGQLRNVVIRNIKATGAGIPHKDKRFGKDGVSPIVGIEGHPIEKVTLENISIAFEGYDAPLVTQEQVPEKEAHYPEHNMFGVLPAYGFYIRHAKDIHLKNIDLRFDRTEARPAIVLDDVHGFDLENAALDIQGNATEAVVETGSSDVRISHLTKRSRQVEALLNE